jgi:fucose permease
MIIASGTVISSVFSARIIKRLGTGIVTSVSVLMTAVALAGFSLSKSFYFLCFFAIPLGLGAGSVDAALNNYVALHYKARHMSWLHCFWGVGASVGPLIMSSFLINKNSWNLGYRTISIIQFCLVFILFISLPLWDKKRAGTEKQTSAKFKDLFSIGGVKQILVAFFCYCSLETITGLWGASYLVMEKNIAPEIAARWITLYYLGITAGRFISGFITMKLNNKQMVRMGQIIIACGITTIFLPIGGSAALFCGLFMIGLGCAPIYPSLLHETPVNFGEENSQQIMGIQMGSAYVGTTIMPPIFGWLASYLTFGIFPFFIGIILIVMIIAVEVINRRNFIAIL